MKLAPGTYLTFKYYCPSTRKALVHEEHVTHCRAKVQVGRCSRLVGSYK